MRILLCLAALSLSSFQPCQAFHVAPAARLAAPLRGNGRTSLAMPKQPVSSTAMHAAASEASPKPTCDYATIGKLIGATAVQFGALTGTSYALERYFLTRLTPCQAKAFVGVFFSFLALRSRFWSPLSAKRPSVADQDKGKAERKMPSWAPPGIAFPFIWLTIAVLRGLSSSLIYETLGTLVNVPLSAMMLHLSIGDTWNNINNVRRELGFSAVVVGFVWLSVGAATGLYYKTLPLAGRILSPSFIWISVATVLVLLAPTLACAHVALDCPLNVALICIHLEQQLKASLMLSVFNLSTSAQVNTIWRINGKASTYPIKSRERINETIELDSPKVVTMETLKAGNKKVYCRCWKSGTFPLCDGSHVAWNKANGRRWGCQPHDKHNKHTIMRQNHKLLIHMRSLRPEVTMPVTQLAQNP
ncbi:unnamed protein product [Chrysoparadoxa australica]